ncbi:hypothetical protein GCM10023176_20840 [Micromonospora coerulea]|uniref:Uncharacterized protein n=1 Tax=Micromonospora coerulea TaxID=47856 RepID=A0ABP8SEN3_9ACTN
MPEELLRQGSQAIGAAQGGSTAAARALKTVLMPPSGRRSDPVRAGSPQQADIGPERRDVTFSALVTLFAAFDATGKFKVRISLR